MRSLAFASLVLVAASAGACSAVDNFDKFKFVDDGGTDGGTAGVDMSLPGFGQPCTDQCQASPLRPLMCLKMLGSRPIPGGMCTRACTITGAISCSDYPDAVCVHVESMDVCLPRCDPSQNRTCRTGLSCCDNQNVVTGPGACAPSTTDLCH